MMILELVEHLYKGLFAFDHRDPTPCLAQGMGHLRPEQAESDCRRLIGLHVVYPEQIASIGVFVAVCAVFCIIRIEQRGVWKRSSLNPTRPLIPTSAHNYPITAKVYGHPQRRKCHVNQAASYCIRKNSLACRTGGAVRWKQAGRLTGRLTRHRKQKGERR